MEAWARPLAPVRDNHPAFLRGLCPGAAGLAPTRTPQAPPDSLPESAALEPQDPQEEVPRPHGLSIYLPAQLWTVQGPQPTTWEPLKLTQALRGLGRSELTVTQQEVGAGRTKPAQEAARGPRPWWSPLTVRAPALSRTHPHPRATLRTRPEVAGRETRKVSKCHGDGVRQSGQEC